MKRVTITLALATLPSAANASPALADAKAYVVSIYRAIPHLDFDYRRLRYAPELARLIQRDYECAIRRGGICAIEAVPFCECQDTADDYAILDTNVRAGGANQATVTVTLRNGRAERFDVDLDGSSGVWRVVDIHGPRLRSFLAFLRRAKV